MNFIAKWFYRLHYPSIVALREETETLRKMIYILQVDQKSLLEKLDETKLDIKLQNREIERLKKGDLFEAEMSKFSQRFQNFEHQFEEWQRVIDKALEKL